MHMRSVRIWLQSLPQPANGGLENWCQHVCKCLPSSPPILASLEAVPQQPGQGHVRRPPALFTSVRTTHPPAPLLVEQARKSCQDSANITIPRICTSPPSRPYECGTQAPPSSQLHVSRRLPHIPPTTHHSGCLLPCLTRTPLFQLRTPRSGSFLPWKSARRNATAPRGPAAKGLALVRPRGQAHALTPSSVPGPAW